MTSRVVDVLVERLVATAAAIGVIVDVPPVHLVRHCRLLDQEGENKMNHKKLQASGPLQFDPTRSGGREASENETRCECGSPGGRSSFIPTRGELRDDASHVEGSTQKMLREI